MWSSGCIRWMEPNIHISSHHRGRPIWNEAIQSFIPDDNSPSGMLYSRLSKRLYGIRRCYKVWLRVWQNKH